MLAIFIFVLPFAILQRWTNYPIDLIKARKSKLTVDEAYLEHRRRSAKGAKIVLIFIFVLLIFALRLWYISDQRMNQIHFYH